MYIVLNNSINPIPNSQIVYDVNNKCNTIVEKKNNIDYIVYNNALLESNEYSDINKICEQSNVEVVNFIPNGSYYSDPSQSHCCALTRIWEDFKDSNEKISWHGAGFTEIF